MPPEFFPPQQRNQEEMAQVMHPQGKNKLLFDIMFIVMFAFFVILLLLLLLLLLLFSFYAYDTCNFHEFFSCNNLCTLCACVPDVSVGTCNEIPRVFNWWKSMIRKAIDQITCTFVVNWYRLI